MSEVKSNTTCRCAEALALARSETMAKVRRTPHLAADMGPSVAELKRIEIRHFEHCLACQQEDERNARGAA